jgi:hypothetical protein
LVGERRECVRVTVRANEIVYLVLIEGKRDEGVREEGEEGTGK